MPAVEDLLSSTWQLEMPTSAIADYQHDCKMPRSILPKDCCVVHGNETVGEHVLTEQNHFTAHAEQQPEIPLVLGGEAPDSIRPWTQQCFQRCETGRLTNVATVRSWVAVTGLSSFPLPPAPAQPRPREHCELPGFSCGCFVRCPPVSADECPLDSRRESKVRR